jgi:hypothetical protein
MPKSIIFTRLRAGELPERPLDSEETLFLDAEGQLKTLSGRTGQVEEPSGSTPIASSDLTDAGAAFPAFAAAETVEEQAALLASELRIKAPDNSIWKLSISNAGVISQTKL